jgi:hypothetical protein
MILIADADLSTDWNFWTSPGSQAREIAIILAILFLVVLGVFMWAAFWRKPRRRRKHAYHHHHSASDGASVGGLPQSEKEKSGFFQRKRRHRRQHRHERPINPTLAQVGGLPPPRRKQPPES